MPRAEIKTVNDEECKMVFASLWSSDMKGFDNRTRRFYGGTADLLSRRGREANTRLHSWQRSEQSTSIYDIRFVTHR